MCSEQLRYIKLGADVNIINFNSNIELNLCFFLAAAIIQLVVFCKPCILKILEIHPHMLLHAFIIAEEGHCNCCKLYHSKHRHAATYVINKNLLNQSLKLTVSV